MAVACACAASLAACGSSGPGAGGTGSAAAGNRDSALQFSTCMRAHGVSNFPDPGANGTLRIPTGVSPQSPSFQAAQKACGRYLPMKGAPGKMSASDRRRALAFAECVRAHGVPSFPDPSDTPPRGAQFVIALRGMVFAFTSAFDPRSPAFRHAAAACGVTLP